MILGYLLTLTPEQYTAGFIGLTALLSWLFNLFGWVRASKFVGTFGLDAGRVHRAITRVWPVVKPAVLAWLDRKKATAALLFIAFATACGGVGPAYVPTARESVTLACNLVDDALTVAIVTSKQSELEELEKFAKPVDVLTEVEKAVKDGKELCENVSKLEDIAVSLACQDCVTAVKLAKGQVCE